jgi:hypothetical protein
LLRAGPAIYEDARHGRSVQLVVTDANQDEFNELDASVGRAMTAAGGPPPGLMSHVVYPEGAGFIVAEVWRVESEGHRYLDEVLRPRLVEMGLTGNETSARPVWSFARP